jgi:ribosomal-protein-serine acetyltransferase
MTIAIDNNLELQLTNQSQAEALFLAIDNNRKHLSTFLPWVSKMQTINDFKKYISASEVLIAEGKEVSFAIIYDQKIVGRIGLHHLNIINKNASIGYWLIKEAEGKGIITKCCKALIDYGFNKVQLQRIEIKAAVHNLKSQAIPVKLNFKEEGILRQAEFVNNEFLDLILYSLLRNEWEG